MKHIKRIRIHYEGNPTLIGLGLLLLVLNIALYFLFPEGVGRIIFWIVLAVSLALYAIVVNFFRCPIRVFEQDSDGLIVAPADGTVVVVEETEEPEVLGDRRRMVSIFMSVTNVHANWVPCTGVVKKVEHHNGNFHKAWLPKASIENERSTIVIETPQGVDVLVRQVAGAVARRIVTYVREGDDCFVDEHLGFIKFGSRVDVYLPLDAEILVERGTKTVGNQTVLARLKTN